MLRPLRVLVVDEMDVTGEVLRAALERSGTEVLSVREPRAGLEMARQRQPDVIVLDLEVDTEADEELTGGFAAESRSQAKPLVMLGTARCRSRSAGGQFVAKPYEYGMLVRKIEELLANTPRVDLESVAAPPVPTGRAA